MVITSGLWLHRLDDYTNMTTITDITVAISASVPSTWTDIDRTQLTSGSAPEAKLIASTDIKNILWTSPYVGITINSTKLALASFPSYVSALMNNYKTTFSQCHFVNIVLYSDDTYHGQVYIIQNCDNSEDVYLGAVVQPAPRNYEVSMLLNSSPNARSIMRRLCSKPFFPA